MASDCRLLRSTGGLSPPTRGPGPDGSQDATQPRFHSEDGSAPASNGVAPAKPGAARRHPFGLIILTLFLVVQSIDGAFTYFAVLRFGPGVEGNPLVATLIHALGQGPGLVSVKLFAAMLGAVLYVTSGYRI